MRVLVALLVTAAFATLAYALGMVGVSGAVGGLVLGLVIFTSAGFRGFAVLALFVAGGSLLTRLGYERKRRSGTAQGRGGRRGARNALANCSVATVCAVLYALTGEEVLSAAFVASFGAALADTTESEVGQLSRAPARLITTLQRVGPGTDGAITPLGTLSGAVAAGVMALFGRALGLVDGPGEGALVAVAAFAGTLADSVIGAKTPNLGNEATNVICTLTAAVIVLVATPFL